MVVMTVLVTALLQMVMTVAVAALPRMRRTKSYSDGQEMTVSSSTAFHDHNNHGTESSTNSNAISSAFGDNNSAAAVTRVLLDL